MEKSERPRPWDEFVEVIWDRWWQSHEPIYPDLTIARELSVVKRLLNQGWDRETLLGALGEYQGPPASLISLYGTGNRGQLNILADRWRRRQHLDTTAISHILRDMASG